MRVLSDEEIIAIRKSTFSYDFKPWSDTLAFARALLEAAQKDSETKGE